MKDLVEKYKEVCLELKNNREKEIEFLKSKLNIEKKFNDLHFQINKEGKFNSMINENIEYFTCLNNEIYESNEIIMNLEEEIDKLNF